MTDEERLRVQNSTSLCIALISFSVALIGGAVAGVLAISDKIPSNCGSFVLAGLIVVAIILLTLSVMSGGRGISATNDAIKANPNQLSDHYDNGYFSRQVFYGLGGLSLGAIAFVLLAVLAMTGHRGKP